MCIYKKQRSVGALQPQHFFVSTSSNIHHVPSHGRIRGFLSLLNMENPQMYAKNPIFLKSQEVLNNHQLLHLLLYQSIDYLFSKSPSFQRFEQLSHHFLDGHQ